MTTREDILGYFAEHRGAGAVQPIARHFKITNDAARLHLERLRRRQLIALRGAYYVMTDAGRRRLAYYRGELEQGKITFA